MDTEEIKNIINHALAILYRTERKLIDDKAHEQTISARLMLHLQHLLPDWDVDVEFNRQGENSNRCPKTDVSGTKRKPDIIIHKRGPDGPNLAIILVKCEWNTEPRVSDSEVARSIKHEQHYQAAFRLEIKGDSGSLSEA